MRIDELRSKLHEHGDAVEPGSHPARLQEVHGRIRTARRRRGAVAVAGAAAAVTAIALTVVPNLQRDPAPAPAGPDPVAGYTRDGVTFRDDVLGERLLGAVLGDPGEAQVKTEVVVGEEGLRFSPTCYGVGIDYAVEYSWAGRRMGVVGCQTEKDRDPGAGGLTFDAAPEVMLEEWGLEPGDTTAFVLRLVAGEDGDGATVRHPDAVIGGGVYTDTRPRRMVVGAEVPELIEHEGRVWELTTTYESAPRARRVEILSDQAGAPVDQLMAVAMSGLRGRASYEVLLDGEVIDGHELNVGKAYPLSQTLQVLEQGTVYRLEARVTEGATGRTRLALLSYEPR